MSSNSKKRPGQSLLIIASLMIITAGLKAAGDMLTPLLVALFFSVLCIPPMMRLKKQGVPDGLAIALVIVAAIVGVLGITAIIAGSLSGFDAKIPEYQAALNGRFTSLTTWLQQQGIQIDSNSISSHLSTGAIFDLIKNVATELLGALSQILLVLLTMIFILVEASNMPNKLRRAINDPRADLKSWAEAMEQVQKYVAIKAQVSLVTGLLATGLTAALGVDFPLLWGLIAFFFNFIPNIGSVIAAIPPMLLALVQFGNTSAAIVGIGYFAINMIMGNLIEPRLMGRRLGLSTLVVFLSLIFWNWVWGPVGMVLSVPLTVIVKILLEHSEQFRGVAVMLGPDVDLPETKQ